MGFLTDILSAGIRAGLMAMPAVGAARLSRELLRMDAEEARARGKEQGGG